jgi:hypothetical protein
MSMMYIRILVGLHLKYYTDGHDVDEDLRTIVSQSGRWENGTSAGVTCRSINAIPSYISNVVAYKYNKNSTPVMRVEF